MILTEPPIASTSIVKTNFSNLVFLHKLRTNNQNSPTLTSRVCEYIRGKISSGKFGAGEKIVELQIAEELEMSCVPVREAMSKLEQEGWVERIPNRGVFVKKLEIKDIQQLFELREVLEIAAVEKIAVTITNEQLAELRQVADVISAARFDKDESTARNADMHFHRLLIHFSGNQRMELMFESILLQASGAFFRFAEDHPFLVKQVRKSLRVSDHAQICEALANHDAKKTIKLVRSHMKTAYKTVAVIEKVVKSFGEEETTEDGD